jgi:hypothetical protein
MAEQAIDYAALAKANGATASMPPPSTIDYAALARAHGGTSETAGASVLQPPIKEPTTYAGGFLRSAADTVGRTAKGVVEGAASVIDPRTYVNAIRTGYDVMTNPIAAAEAGRAIVDEAGRVFSGDPEAGGRVIGQIVAGKFVPIAVEGARAAMEGRSLPSMPNVGPAMRNGAARVVKHGTTAAGATIAGGPGAVVGATIGEELAARIRAGGAPKAHVPTAEGYSRYEPSVSTYQPEATSPGESGVGETPPPSGRPPVEPTPAPEAAPTSAPVPRPTATAGHPTRTAGQMSPTAIQSDLGLAARRAGLKLTEPEYQQAEALVRSGQTAEDAVRSLQTTPTAAPAQAPTPAVLAEDMSPAELQAYRRMKDSGIPDAVAKHEIVKARAAAQLMNRQFGLKTPTEAETRFPKGMRGKAKPPTGSGS